MVMYGTTSKRRWITNLEPSEPKLDGLTPDNFWSIKGVKGDILDALSSIIMVTSMWCDARGVEGGVIFDCIFVMSFPRFSQFSVFLSPVGHKALWCLRTEFWPAKPKKRGTEIEKKQHSPSLVWWLRRVVRVYSIGELDTSLGFSLPIINDCKFTLCHTHSWFFTLPHQSFFTRFFGQDRGTLSIFADCCCGAKSSKRGLLFIPHPHLYYYKPPSPFPGSHPTE